MKRFLVAATTVVAGLTVGLVQADEGKEKGKGKGGDPAKRAEAMIKRLDTDGNGTISKEEFAAGPMAAKAKERGDEGAIDRIFASRDTNSDGQLDQAELSAPPKGKGPGDGKGKGEGKGKGPRPEGKRDSEGKPKPEGKRDGEGGPKPEGKRDGDGGPKPEGKPDGDGGPKPEAKPDGEGKPKAE